MIWLVAQVGVFAHSLQPQSARRDAAPGRAPGENPVKVFIFDLLPYSEHLDHLKQPGET